MAKSGRPPGGPKRRVTIRLDEDTTSLAERVASLDGEEYTQRIARDVKRYLTVRWQREIERRLTDAPEPA